MLSEPVGSIAGNIVNHGIDLAGNRGQDSGRVGPVPSVCPIIIASW